MPWRCSCGWESEHRGALNLHIGKLKSSEDTAEHSFVGWVNPEDGSILSEKPKEQEVHQKAGDASRVPGAAPTTAVSDATILKLFPKAIAIAMTPDIMISYMCALKRGFDQDLETFLSMACEDFWTGRNINPYAEVAGKEAVGVGQGGPKRPMEGSTGG